NNLGLLFRETGRPEEAEKAYREALTVLKQSAADFPSLPAGTSSGGGSRADFRQHMGGAYHNLGGLLATMGRLSEAEAAYRDALAIKQQIAADFPTRPELRKDLATSQNALGHLLRAKGSLAQSEAAYRDALSIQKQLAADFPSRPEFRRDLALSHNNLGL